MEDHESGKGHKQFRDRQEAGGGVWKIEDGGEKDETENRARGLPIPGGQRGRGGGRMGGRGIRGGAKQERWAGAKVDILVKSEPDDEKYKQGIPTHKSTHSLSEVKLEKKECGRVNKSPAEGLFCTECHQKLKPGHVAHRRRGKQEIYCSSSCLASHIASSKLPANQLPSPLPPQHPVVPPSSASHLHNPHQSTVEEAASTSIPCSVCGKNTPARHEVTYQNETFQLCSDKCLTRFGSQHQTPATENQRENKATRSVCHYCMGSASPQYFLNMSNGTRYAVCSTDCLSAFQLLLSQGVLPVPLPPLSEISPPAPPSAPVVLKCVQCRESFSHIPDLLEWKGTVLQFCGRACVRIWARNVTAVCDQCRRSKPVACRAHFPGLSCTFCSDTCRWLHQAAFSRKLGKGAGTCTHCLQLCSRSSAQSSSVSRLCFCSNICQKSYTLCYIKAYPCDRCHVTCAPEAFLPWGGAVRRFCNHACLMLYCFDQAGGGLLGNIVTSSSGEEKPTDILDKLYAGTSLGSSNSTISFEEHSTSHGFTKSNHNASAFAVGEVQVEDHSKNQTLGTSQAKQRASRREQVAWSVGEGDISRAAGRTDVEVALRAWLRGSLGRKHRIDASQLLSKAQRLSFEMAAAFTPTHPWLRGFVAREGISLGDTERDVEDTLGEDGDGENNANVNSHPSPDGVKISRIPFPVPVPIYVPVPMHMYCQPTPSPVALPIPIPIPLLIPSSKASEQRKVHSEAEQAQEKGEEERFNLGQGGLLALPAKRENSKSKRKSDIIAASVVASPASLESRSRLSHSVASPSSSVCPNTYLDPEVEILNSIGSESKAKLSLGHKAWKLWADGSLRPKKGQPSVFLSLSQSERASALYAFASEAQRPNGQDYRPDCLYYLCLGLQRYLSEAGIEDDIFSDSIYGDFFGALSSKLAAWQVPESQRSCLSSQLLWLSGRLGARSPSSLQAALSYFLFWGFGIRNVDAHARLTFSRLAAGPRKARRAGRMERRERRGGCKPLCLGLYPAVSPTCEQGNSGRKRRREDEPEKEIPEDAENPLHCPVRLFEFYISKCPAEVRARDGPLYLEPLVPCDPDSNLWFSDTALSPRSLLSLLAPLPHLQDLSLKK